jgi:hypothetical protein
MVESGYEWFDTMRYVAVPESEDVTSLIRFVERAK